ncbi:hypothetical protein GCM10009721_10990 [Terrabacter tumescens]|uniref:Uncharacterized protein n=1 Tax=Terrabacter tumescens TaxID=60443 RepID=A0ABQ2HRE1_9MICO|nr:hypothetical protein GCM10009721_10990 [Terrabacter tumescens]
MVAHQLTVERARRIAVHAQLLDRPRPTDLVATVERLTILQIDPTAAIAPSADLVLWSRLGRTYDPAHLTAAIEQDRSLVETVAYVRSPKDVPAVLAEVREAEPYRFMADWLEANDSFRRDILDTLEADGPLLSRDIPDTSVVPWPSTGWTNNRNITKMPWPWPCAARSPSRAARGVSATSTSPGASTRPTCRGSPSSRPSPTATSAASPPSASPARAAPSCRARVPSSARRVSPPRSKGCRARGASTRHTSTSSTTSVGAPPC